jgi:hypothetical protein
MLHSGVSSSWQISRFVGRSYIIELVSFDMSSISLSIRPRLCPPMAVRKDICPMPLWRILQNADLVWRLTSVGYPPHWRYTPLIQVFSKTSRESPSKPRMESRHWPTLVRRMPHGKPRHVRKPTLVQRMPLLAKSRPIREPLSHSD